MGGYIVWELEGEECLGGYNMLKGAVEELMLVNRIVDVGMEWLNGPLCWKLRKKNVSDISVR